MIDVFVPIDPNVPPDRLPELKIPGRDPLRPTRGTLPVPPDKGLRAGEPDVLRFQLDADALTRLRLAQVTRGDGPSFDRTLAEVQRDLAALRPAVDGLGPLEQASVAQALVYLRDAGLDAETRIEALRTVLKDLPESKATSAILTGPPGPPDAALRSHLFDGRDLDAFAARGTLFAVAPRFLGHRAARALEWGWTRSEPNAPCAKVENIPRACLDRQCIAYPALLEDPLHERFFDLFVQRSWAWLYALPDEQLDLAETQLWEQGQLSRLIMMKGLRAAHGFARRPEPQKVQGDVIESWRSAGLLPAPGVAADQPRWVDSPPSDTRFLDRLLNGIYPPLLEPDPETEGGLVARIDTTQYDYDGKYQALPDVKVHLRTQADGDVRLAAITLAYRDQAPTRFTPADDGPWSAWSHAKRVARMAANVHGQVDWHLARGHLVGEMVQVALSRTLDDDHPLAQLLKPHVLGTAGINNLGEDIIVGAKGAIVRCSALSFDGSLQLAADRMGRLDWRGFAPRTPLHAGHVFAHAQARFWDRLRAFVEAFFADDEPQTWNPTRRRQARAFADELLRNSMGAKETAEGLDRVRPEDRSELPRPALAPSRGVNDKGEPAALHPIDPADRDGWIQFCTWVIHHVSFVHSWSNDGMVYDNGHLLHGPLGLKKVGVPTGEADFWIHYALDDDDGYFQLLLVELLVRTRWLNLGLQDEDAPPRIPQQVRTHFSEPAFVAEMRDLLLDPARVRARANV